VGYLRLFFLTTLCPPLEGGVKDLAMAGGGFPFPNSTSIPKWSFSIFLYAVYLQSDREAFL